MTRGILHDVKHFINELSSRYLPFPRYNKKTKKMETKYLQMRVCPIQLWDISYSKDQRDIVHNTIFAGGEGKPINSRIEKFMFGLRKLMGLKKLPKYKKEKVMAMRPIQNVEVLGIGVKDDFWIEPDGRHVSEKEKSKEAYEGI